MNRFRVELIDPASGDRMLVGRFSTEGEAARRILQMTELGIIEMWNEHVLLARIDRSPKDEAPFSDLRLAAE